MPQLWNLLLTHPVLRKNISGSYSSDAEDGMHSTCTGKKWDRHWELAFGNGWTNVGQGKGEGRFEGSNHNCTYKVQKKWPHQKRKSCYLHVIKRTYSFKGLWKQLGFWGCGYDSMNSLVRLCTLHSLLACLSWPFTRYNVGKRYVCSYFLWPKRESNFVTVFTCLYFVSMCVIFVIVYL
jgi:hypothetical protein